MPPKKRSRKPPPRDVQRRMETVLKAIFEAEEPSPVMVDLSDSVRPNKKFEVSLTENQRKSLIEWCNLPGRLKSKLESAGTGKQIVFVTRNELDEFYNRIGEYAQYSPPSDRKRLGTLQAQIAELFAQELVENLAARNQEKCGRSSSARAASRLKPTKTIYQFKITLLDTAPVIWRRIQVQDCFLDDLHHHIQAVMGWENNHLHHFIIGRERYGIPKWLDDDVFGSKVVDSAKTLLSDLVPANGKRIKIEYTYDMGDNWEHEVLFEGIVKPDRKTKYPVCVEGERACPPENCGGTPGYQQILVALDDPESDEYHEVLDFVGRRFDPDRFDAKAATWEMREYN